MAKPRPENPPNNNKPPNREPGDNNNGDGGGRYKPTPEQIQQIAQAAQLTVNNPAGNMDPNGTARAVMAWVNNPVNRKKPFWKSVMKSAGLLGKKDDDNDDDDDSKPPKKQFTNTPGPVGFTNSNMRPPVVSKPTPPPPPRPNKPQNPEAAGLKPKAVPSKVTGASLSGNYEVDPMWRVKQRRMQRQNKNK